MTIICSVCKREFGGLPNGLIKFIKCDACQFISSLSEDPKKEQETTNNYVREVVSNHIECLKLEEEEVKQNILVLEKQLKIKHESLRNLRDKRSELELFMNQYPPSKTLAQ